MNSEKRILILDDNEEILTSVSDVLKYENFAVRAVADIFTFYKTIKEWRPDLVILDYILQGINGGDICMQLKSSVSTNELPVIMMSAYPAAFNSAARYGYDDLLIKPFDINNLLSAVKKHIFKT